MPELNGYEAERSQMDLNLNAYHGVLQCSVAKRNFEQFAAGLFHRLLDGNRHLARLALAHADASIAVADDSKRCESEHSSALYNFGNAVHRNHFFAQSVRAVACLLLHSCH